MQKNLYMVYDKTAQTTIGGIIQEHRDAPAIRAFHDALGMKDSLLAQHPADYTLLQIGILEEETGLLLPMLGDSPVVIATGSSWLEAIEEL